MQNKKNWTKHIDFLFLDTLILIVSFILGYYFRHGNFNVIYNTEYISLIYISIIINFIIYILFEPYKNILKRGILDEFIKTLILTIMLMVVMIAYMFVFKISSVYSRASIIYTYIMFFVLSYIINLIYKNILLKTLKSNSNRNRKSLLIICKQKDIEMIKNNIVNNYYNFYHIAGVYIIDKKLEKKDNIETLIYSSSEFIEYISTRWIDEILVFTNYVNLSTKIRKAIEDSKIPFHIIINESKLFINKPQTIQKIGYFNVITIEANERKNYQIVIKRMFDIFASLFGCIVTIVVALIIGPIIYIKSPGNILYVSNRVGKNGKIFKFYKFRSMVLNADKQKDKLKSRNRLKDGMMFKIDDDPRIIPGIGNFIRRTSLDEFPQFFNVLKGDMSLVGTRPPTLDEWNKYSPYYRSRLSIKPGITGLWQVSGRSNIIDFDEVVKLDNEYIDNFSIKLDIQILIKTIFVIFKKEGSM